MDSLGMPFHRAHITEKEKEEYKKEIYDELPDPRLMTEKERAAYYKVLNVVSEVVHSFCGDKTKGTMVFGTGDGDGDTKDYLKDMFLNPEKYNIIPYPAEKGGYFLPNYQTKDYMENPRDLSEMNNPLKSLQELNDELMESIGIPNERNKVKKPKTITEEISGTRLSVEGNDTRENLLNSLIKSCNKLDTNLISDGYHTFGELYAHRIQLFIVLCKTINNTYQHSYLTSDTEPTTHVTTSPVWKSKRHSDGELAFEGWFVLGINKEAGKQMTYHLPMSEWDNLESIIELEKAPDWDGHTSDDVLERLKTISL